MPDFVVVVPAVTKKVTRIEEVQAAKYAARCDGCGRLYRMAERHGIHSELTMIFDKERYNVGGNFDTWSVRSFKCVNDIYNGTWTNTKQANGFKMVKATPISAEVKNMRPCEYFS